LGIGDVEMAESLCVLLAAGGDHIEDFETLRDDEGLSELPGHGPPSPRRAKRYLYAFDEGMQGGEAADGAHSGGPAQADATGPAREARAQRWDP